MAHNSNKDLTPLSYTFHHLRRFPVTILTHFSTLSTSSRGSKVANGPVNEGWQNFRGTRDHEHGIEIEMGTILYSTVREHVRVSQASCLSCRWYEVPGLGNQYRQNLPWTCVTAIPIPRAGYV